MFAAILVWLWLNYGSEVAGNNVFIIGLFIASGLLGYFLGKNRPGWIWVPFLILAIDAALLGFTLLAPGRTYPPDWPWATVLRQPSYLYIMLLLALSAISLQPLLVLWAGVVSVAVWSIGTWLIVQSPDAFTSFPANPDLWLKTYLDPHYVHIDDALVRAFVTLIASAILAVAVSRARSLVRDQAEAARERANLARYVAPNLVDQLAVNDQPMGSARSINVAVLFADIKGFTSRAERLGAAGTMAFLQQFHGRMAEIVFEHHGTLDKFIGDGLMATFGTPHEAKDDATRSMNCALAMIEAAALLDSGDDYGPVEIRIGLHYGLVTIGDIGGGGRFEFAVIGDAVNVASRIERLTRRYQEPLLMSGGMIERLQAEGFDCGQFRLSAERAAIRGRADTVDLWTLGSVR